MDKSTYSPTIGLEIHAELNTKTKMFCNSKNDPDEKKPNVNICPVCMAEPGTLPVINRAAVKHVLRVGTAIGADLADFTEFDRKNYFYPDIPKGYQISQFAYPLISHGSINDVEVTRIHLEEDTARSQHGDDGASLVDFNRAGLPLMELVTEPVVKNATQAGAFARELQLLLRTLGASEANMEKGQMRVEANISVSKTETFGTKVEVKNLNSFKSVERAIDYEIERQINVIESGGEVVQETRGWDDAKQITFSQRKKENSDDYRYFPDPDLPKLKLSEIEEFDTELLKKSLPELPWEKRARFKDEFGLKDEDVEMYVRTPVFSEFYEGVAKGLKGDKKLLVLASNHITSDLVGIFKEKGTADMNNIKTDSFAEVILMRGDNKISSSAVTTIIKIMVEKGGEPEEIAKKEGLLQDSSEDTLIPIVEKLIKENEKAVAEYKAGKESALQFFIGQGMKETRGSANPQVLKVLFEKELKK